MKISKAIEIIDIYLEHAEPLSYRDLDNAIKLGAEALNRILKGRNPDRPYVCYLLPSEPPEGEKD